MPAAFFPFFPVHNQCSYAGIVHSHAHLFDPLDLSGLLRLILPHALALLVDVAQRAFHIGLVAEARLVLGARRNIIVDGDVAVLARPLLARDPYVGHAGSVAAARGTKPIMDHGWVVGLVERG